ncbi:MAG: serine hydrolase domain-containing protein [Desulfobacterales bacterium]
MDIAIEGFVAPGFERVKEAFAANWEGYEVGASCAVVHKGKWVVDLWGGYRQRDLQKPWQKDTLVNVYSTTKGMAALTIAILVDEGRLDYDDRVVDYWPEFGANGKEKVTVAQVLSHQAGICGVSERITNADLYDWEKMTRLLAEQKPFWEPCKTAGYHAVTWGYPAGEIVRRVTGKTLGTVFREKVAKPLNADFFIGLPDAEMDRVADLVGPNRARVPQKPVLNPEVPRFYSVALMNPGIRPFKDACSTAWRKAEIPAANGQANARAIARIYGALANGGEIEGIRIISKAGIDRAVREEIVVPEDPVTGSPMRFARGFMLNVEDNYGPNPDSFGHGGAGGSIGFADPEANIAVGYAMNQMQVNPDDEPRAGFLVDAVYKSI